MFKYLLKHSTNNINDNIKRKTTFKQERREMFRFESLAFITMLNLQMQNQRLTFFSQAPSGPPLDVAFISRTTESLSVSWRAPDEDVRNGKLTGYQVCYSDQRSRMLENLTCIERNKTALSHTINNLQQTTKYFVTVSAGTSAGFGTKSLEINKTTNGGECISFNNAYNTLLIML